MKVNTSSGIVIPSYVYSLRVNVFWDFLLPGRNSSSCSNDKFVTALEVMAHGDTGIVNGTARTKTDTTGAATVGSKRGQGDGQ